MGPNGPKECGSFLFFGKVFNSLATAISSTDDGGRGAELGRQNVARLCAMYGVGTYSMAFLPPRERDRDVQRRRTFILRKYLLKKLLAGDSIRRALVVRSYWRIDYSRSRSPSSATLVYAE